MCLVSLSSSTELISIPPKILATTILNLRYIILSNIEYLGEGDKVNKI